VKLALKDLETEFRRLANDQGTPPLWSHDEVTRYANESLVDAVERGELIEDDSTPTICRIPIAATKATYLLSPLVLRVTRARLASRGRPLTHSDPDSLDRLFPGGWETVTGSPHYFIETPGRVRLVGIPPVADVLLLTVRRRPLRPMVGPDDCPEIDPTLHYRLLDGMLARAYMRFDSVAETYDPAKADRHEKLFTISFGERLTAKVMRSRRVRRPRVTRPGPYA
jgi:hypothetical protein